MTELGSHAATDPTLFRQRRRTVEIVKGWGLTALYAGHHSRIPIEKITEETGNKVDPTAWATPGTPQSKLNLLARLSTNLIDLDLDVRLTDDLHARPLQWTPQQRELAEQWFFKPFRAVLIQQLGIDSRNHWGRASLGGTGHWALRLAPNDEMTLEERRGRIKQLGFKLTVGPFTVALEPRSPAKAAAKVFMTLPGSVHADGDHIGFHNDPPALNHQLKEIDIEPLCKAIYCFAMQVATAPLTGEGERHMTALLVSGVLRREVDHTERDGGNFTRDDARALFEAIFQGDPELRDRRQVFERDFEKADSSELPGYPALGKRIGEDAAYRISLMLHGFDRSALERLSERIVFVNTESIQCVDVEENTGGNNLTLHTRPSIAALHPDYINRPRGKPISAISMLGLMASRRQVDDWIAVPGHPQGEYLYASPGGQLAAQRRSDEDRCFVNIAPGWVTPYVEERIELTEAWNALDHMIGWLTGNIKHRKKILQTLAFKMQNPMVKAQFALAVVGGQGIGKSTFFYEVMRALFGASVKATSMNELYGGNYTLSPLLGASLLIVEEADAIPDFSLAKQVHRNARLEVNLKFGGKGQQWCFGIPIYLSNEPSPKLNAPGEIDRTLYIIQAPTQHSLNLSAEEWLAFQAKRTVETDAIRAKLKSGSNLLLGMRQILQEYPVSIQELQDTTHSDSRTEEYRQHDLSPDQMVIQTMLARGYAHHEHSGWAFDAPITKSAFDDGFNELYLKYAGRNAGPRSGKYISRQLQHALGENGIMVGHQVREKGRIYAFPVKLGTLRESFAKIVGTPVSEDTPAKKGHNQVSAEAAKRAWEYWQPKGRLTDTADY